MARLTDAARRDLDETRRLLYVALLCAQQGHGEWPGRFEVAGTLVNAIRHHQNADPDPDPVGLLNRVTACFGATGDETWIREQIRRCTEALGD